MLALGRKPGEYVMIGDDIMVKVVKIDGALRLAIEAPRELKITRGEIYEGRKGNGAAVAALPDTDSPS